MRVHVCNAQNVGQNISEERRSGKHNDHPVLAEEIPKSLRKSSRHFAADKACTVSSNTVRSVPGKQNKILELKQRNQWQQKQSIENLWPGQVSFKLFNRTKPNIDALQNDPRLPLDVKGVDC